MTLAQPYKDSEHLSDNTTDIFKPIVTSAIKTIRGKSKRPDTDAIYRYISKSEATNVDLDFIASILNDLENKNVIFNKPTTYGLDSYLIATHRGSQNISQRQNDNTQSNPGPNLFSNQPESDLEPLTVDKAISSEDEVQFIHVTVTLPDKENDMNFKICETNKLRKHICKLEAQLPAIKS